MRHPFFALIFAIGIVAIQSRAADKPEKLRVIPNLAANERIALYAECAKMPRWGVNGMLMSNQWGPMLAKLNPVLVTTHRANVKVILNDTDKEESGFYVTMMASSYIPQPNDFTVLTRVSQPGDNLNGDIYIYRIIKVR